ncbi:energy transducer TonB [Chryseobacterium sp. A301]
MKNIWVVVFVLFCASGFAQQNEAFKAIKSQVDYEQQMLQYKYQMEYKRASSEVKGVLENQWNSLIVEFQEHVNTAYVGALIQVKNEEDLEELTSSSANSQLYSAQNSPKRLLPPTYSNGMQGLRKEVTNLFYFDSVKPLAEPYQARISFVVNPNGRISRVEAKGEDLGLNRQAQIAFYLLPGQFAPALLDNQPVAYRFELPLILSF